MILLWDVNGSPRYLTFDVLVSETHDFVSEVTSHPVEAGANVTDHVRVIPTALSFEVFRSNEPIENFRQRNYDGTPFEQDPTGLHLKSMQLDVPRFDPPLQPTPGSVFGKITQGAAQIIQAGKDTLFGSTPPSKVEVWTIDSAKDFVLDALNTLEAARDRASLFQVVTPKKTYQDAVLTKCTMKRDAGTGTGATFNLEFQLLRFVGVEIVKAPKPTALRSTSKKNKGVVNMKQVEIEGGEKASIAHEAVGFFKSKLGGG